MIHLNYKTHTHTHARTQSCTMHERTHTHTHTHIGTYARRHIHTQGQADDA